MATEGPAKLKHGKKTGARLRRRDGHGPVSRPVGGTRQEGVRRLGQGHAQEGLRSDIVKEYAKRYGDENRWVVVRPRGLLRHGPAEGQSQLCVTFNRGTLPSLANDNPGYEDCICGHPSPCQVVLPSDAANPARGRDRRGVKGWVRLRERRQRRLPSEPVPPLRDHARHVVK